MKRRDEVVVGAMLIIVLVLGIGGSLWVARGGLSRGYEMYAKFPWGAGLKQGQPVLLAGVNVGFVSDVVFGSDATLLVKMSIKKQYKIPVGTTATVEANGIFGDQLIALRPIKPTAESLPEKDTIPTGVAAPGVAALMARGDSIAGDVKALTARIRSEFVDDGGVKDTRKLVIDLSKLVAQMGSVMAQQNKELTLTQVQARRALASIDSSKIDSLLSSARGTMASVDKLVKSFDSSRVALNGLLAKADHGPGTIGKLMNDPSIYNRLDALTLRADSLLTDIMKNPKKYINLRVF